MVRGGIFVSTENNGLRFDIYERVNLPENVAAIEELEEIELVPRIQVIDQGEVVLLQGQLVLNGIYRGEGFGQEQIALEHWIPVEISLPMNRVQQLDEITVDIDTFHVEPVSERALNITGVLALRGIYLEDQEQEWQDQQQYDQLNFVAEAGEESDEQQSSLREEESDEQQSDWSEQGDEQVANWREENDEQLADAQHWQTEAKQEHEQWSVEAQQPQYTEQQELQWREQAEEAAQLLQQEQLEAEVAYSAESQWEHTNQPIREQEEVESEASYALSDAEEQAYYSEASYAEQNEREQDLTAWQATEQESAKVTTSFGIKDLLSTSLREQAANEVTRLEAERDRIQEQLQQVQKQTEPIQWKQILLQADGKEQFRKIKMYIVQKDDTLEIIADKYDINPRDLLSHNKLHETAISAGQLLYIP